MGYGTIRRLQSGFTLLEILIVVAILAFLAAFTVPTYQLILAQLQLSTATSEVEELIRLTQQKTVTEQQLYGVTLTANATTVTQFLYNPSTGVKTTQLVYALPVDVRIGQVNFGGVSDVRFGTSGAPNVSGNLVLTDTVRSRNRRIEVRPSGSVLGNQAEF